MAMSFVAKYPDRTEIIPELISTGIEELEHFQQVYGIMRERDIQLAKIIPQDPYIQALLNLCHTDPTRRFLDRLLLASIIECRGAERFRLVSHGLENNDSLSQFYHKLWLSEAKHGNLFVKMALVYFEEEKVCERLNELNQAEGQVVEQLPHRPALH